MANAPHKFKTGIEVTGNASVNGDEVTSNTAPQTLTNKNIDGSNNTITNIPATALPTGIDAVNLADGSVDNSEFQQLNGVTSPIQTQLDSKIPAAEKGAANGVATLDANQMIPSSQLPSIAITDVSVVADIAARDALTVEEGDVAKVTDASADPMVTSGPSAYIYDGTMWIRLNLDDQVLSVNGQTGAVSLSTDDVAEGTTNLYFTEDRAQDAAGSLATDSSKVSLTHDNMANTLTADIIAGSLEDSDISATAGIDPLKIGAGDVSDSEFSRLSGVTSNIQTQLDSKLDDSQLLDDDTFATATASTVPSSESVKAYVDSELADAATSSPGDISETTFAIAESQTSVDVTGLAFDNAVVRSFKVHLSVLIDATAGLYETFELLGIQKGSQWDVAVNTVGDNSQISFDITPAGQVQYSSTTYAGFTAGTIKFRAITTSV